MQPNTSLGADKLKTHAHRWIVLASIIAVAVGVALSHIIEPGVRVEKMMLTTKTPALRIFPATPGPHPIALLAHGNGGSKEMMFRLGEALAVAGFDSYSVDQAGYGESRQSCSMANIHLEFMEAVRALGAVDVFIGHSMGSATGSWSVREAGFRPKLFIGMGNAVHLGKGRQQPLLLLLGRFDEFKPLFGSSLTDQTNAQVILSPWSEHILEVYDPVLLRTAVEAACSIVGRPESAIPTAWRWRLLGLLLGATGALGLIFCLPEIHPRLGRLRGFIVPSVLLLALALTLWPWVGVVPQLRRIPLQLVLLPVIWLALASLGRLRLPRWSLAIITGILGVVCFPFFAYLPYPRFENGIFLFAVLMCSLLISTLLLLPGLLAARITTRGGPRRDGDIAIAIFASYCIGQFMPLFY